MERKVKFSVVVLFALAITLIVMDTDRILPGKVAFAQGPNPKGPKRPATGLGTGFTYQGQLKKSGALVNGTCDFQFSLWDSLSSGTQQGSTQTVSGVTVSNGLFTTQIDFGLAFTGDARWLATAVACPTGSYTTLNPRSPLNAVPYAMGLMPGMSIISTSANPLFAVANNGNGPSLAGYNNTAGDGLYGWSYGRNGVFGNSNGDGASGVYGQNNGGGSTGFGVAGRVIPGSTKPPIVPAGVWGDSSSYYGVYGSSDSLFGVYGVSVSGIGVYGHSDSGYAAWFDGRTKTGVLEITGGSDLAEKFAVVGDEAIEPGTVMVIDENNTGKLKVSDTAYDTKVAGIVSGGGDIKTGLTLHQEGAIDGNLSVTIAGRVYCKAEALSAPIKPGDLLTTSSIAGYCMKATDRERAHGAILGKAMTGLNSGTGLVLVLVNLQ